MIFLRWWVVAFTVLLVLNTTLFFDRVASSSGFARQAQGGPLRATTLTSTKDSLSKSSPLSTSVLSSSSVKNLDFLVARNTPSNGSSVRVTSNRPLGPPPRRVSRRFKHMGAAEAQELTREASAIKIDHARQAEQRSTLHVGGEAHELRRSDPREPHSDRKARPGLNSQPPAHRKVASRSCPGIGLSYVRAILSEPKVIISV
ncbi:hypothetical protein CYMTET_8431 [Cymbomonas tetramitiformis]|uniref:Uncharacterized protein n=1 Tax=Cymbomonas tetramitiformis TaxID=36881 RepID=A0AAE0LG02_9CHLO|nr:hypothetical protein CYMTET_8431 [Cymbomonas tetramitiformis]